MNLCNDAHCVSGCIESMTLDWFQNDALFQNNATHIHAAGFYNFTESVRHSWLGLFTEAKRRGLTSQLNFEYHMNINFSKSIFFSVSKSTV